MIARLQRRLRHDLGAECGEDVGGVGHVMTPEGLQPRARAASEGGQGDLILAKGDLPMPSNVGRERIV